MAAMVAIWISECIILENIDIRIALMPPTKLQFNQTNRLDIEIKFEKFEESQRLPY